jgi:hypothetical protein
MSLFFKKIKAVKGLNLVETCIAISIIAIITSSMWGVATQGYRYMNKYKQVTRARLLAQEGMEDILISGYCGGRWSATDIVWKQYDSDDFLSTTGDDYEGFNIQEDFYNCADVVTAAINPLDPADPPECPIADSKIAFVRVRVTWNSGKEYVLESLVTKMNVSEMCCPSSETVYYYDIDDDGDLDEVIIACPDDCSC